MATKTRTAAGNWTTAAQWSGGLPAFGDTADLAGYSVTMDQWDITCGTVINTGSDAAILTMNAGTWINYYGDISISCKISFAGGNYANNNRTITYSGSGWTHAAGTTIAGTTGNNGAGSGAVFNFSGTETINGALTGISQINSSAGSLAINAGSTPAGALNVTGGAFTFLGQSLTTAAVQQTADIATINSTYLSKLQKSQTVTLGASTSNAGTLVGIVDSGGTQHNYGTCSSGQAYAAEGIVHDSGTVSSSGTLKSDGTYNATGILTDATHYYATGWWNGSSYVASPDFPDAGNVTTADTTNGVAGTLNMSLYELVTVGDTRVANQHATDAAFLETHKIEIIQADTYILAEFGVTGTASTSFASLG